MSQCLSFRTVRHKDAVHKVPCGVCPFCLEAKRSSWMFRIWHEMRNQEHRGYFLTMTYNERFVRRTPLGLSLRFRDVQLFMKRLRKSKYYVKYIVVGEYGSQTRRPHYHALLWTDCPAHLLERFWYREGHPGDSLGSFHIGSLTMQSAMYTLKYIIQPKVQPDWRDGRPGIDTPEKTRAQFSHGIGLQYLSTSVYEWHTFDYDNPVMFSYVDGRQVSLPRYYRNKIFTKWQMRENTFKLKLKLHKNYRQEIRALRDQGIARPHAYYKMLRVEKAKQVISKVKFNQSI